jgi:serine/threonine protein kinase
VRQKKLTKFQAQAVYQQKTRGLVLGNYVLLDRIGRGGMGQVYKARHRRLDLIVALKILPSATKKSEGALKRFEREARTMARLAHPNIVTVYDADEAEGIHFFVMEYVSGSDLSAVIKKHGPLRIAQAIDYTLQAAEALEYAHRQGIIHRDVKPANLLLHPNGTIKVLDMGLARIDESPGDGEAAQDKVRQGSQATKGKNESLTRSGAILGTADYMAPEQAIDSREADHRADIYSLGCTLYFLLTGRTVYPGKTLLQKMIAHCEQPIPSLCDDRPDVSETLNGVFRRMIAKSPEERYRSMSDVLAALRACLPREDDRTRVPQQPSPFTMERIRTMGGQDSDFVPAGPDSSEPPTFNESDLDQSIRFPFVAPPPEFQPPRAHAVKTPDRWILLAGGLVCGPLLAMLLLSAVAIFRTPSWRPEVASTPAETVPVPPNPQPPVIQPSSDDGDGMRLLAALPSDEELQKMQATIAQELDAEIVRRREMKAEEAVKTAEQSPLGQRRQSLQAIIGKYGETKAAEKAHQLLLTLPSDSELWEREAEEALKTAEEALLGQRSQAIQSVIDKYAGTKAAEKARQLLPEILEMEAEDKLNTAKQAPLGQRSQAFQEVIDKYDGTKAAERARQLLPGIRELEAEDALNTAKQAPLGQRSQAIQSVIDKYAGTKAAVEASRLLPGIREMEAQVLVDTAKNEIEQNKLKSARENLNAAKKLSPGGLAAAEAERLIVEVNEHEAAEQLRQARLLLEANPAAARSRLQKIVRDFPNTRAAVEAERLLK